MSLVSNDSISSWWLLISSNRFSSYWIVASSVAVMYDWALTFGQEVELVWKQRWSLMSVLYIVVRYFEIPYIVLTLLQKLPSVSVTDAGCKMFFFTRLVMIVVINAMLSVIMITRLHAMYQRSRKMLIFLVVTFLAVTIPCLVIAVIALRYISGEEFILFGTYQCIIVSEQAATLLIAIVWTLTLAWEILALCLAVWIVVKHFRELRQTSAGGIIGDCFTVLIKSHVIYFASFVVVSCLSLMDLFPVGAEMYGGLRQSCLVMQMFVLGPRLIFSVRKYHAKLVASSDGGTGMTSIAFQERMSTGGDV